MSRSPDEPTRPSQSARPAPPFRGRHGSHRQADRSRTDRGSLSDRLGVPDRFGDAVRNLRRDSGAPRRKRVVLADRRGVRPVQRTVVDLGERPGVGESLVRLLIRNQLRTALVLGGLAALALAGLPLLFWLLPEFAAASVFGVRLSWLLLGVLPFPFLLGIGFVSTRIAERHERDFVNLVER